MPAGNREGAHWGLERRPQGLSRALLVGLVVLFGGAQDHDVSKEPLVGAFFKQRQD